MADAEDLVETLEKLKLEHEHLTPESDDESKSENVKVKVKEEVGVTDTKVEVKAKKISDGPQCYFAWVDHSKFEEGGASAAEIIEILEDRFLETKEKQDLALKFTAMEKISDKGSLAYTHLFAGNVTEARAALSQGRDFVQICSKKFFLDEEYLNGIDYVFDSLEIFMDAVGSEQEKVSEVKVHTLTFPDYDLLSNKSKAAALAMKFYFQRQLRKDFSEQLEIMTEVIKLDPEYFEWHLCKGATFRYKRRAERFDPSKPLDTEVFKEETDEILLAKSLAPSDHPICNLEFIQLLAEKMKRTKRVYSDWQIPLICGNQEFHSVDQVAHYLKSMSLEILQVYQQSVRVNCTIADIFMKWLPKKYRDLNLAETCLLRALDQHPKSSKANHRLAGYYMMGNNPSDMAKAEEYCNLAIKYDPRNFPALADLVQIFLAHPKENEGQLKEIFETHLVNESPMSLSKRNRVDLLFLHGLYLHLRSGFEVEAIESWFKAQEINQGPIPFDCLFFTHERYQWPPGHLSIPKIRTTVEAAQANESFSTGKEENFKLLKISLDKAEDREKNQRAQQTNRGRGRGDGVFGGRAHGRGDGNSNTGYRGGGNGNSGYRGHGRGQNDWRERGYGRGRGNGNGNFSSRGREFNNAGSNSPRKD